MSKGFKHSEETKQKMRKKALGRHHSKETKRKMSKSQEGRKLSKEHIKKLIEINTGKHHSEETKRKIGLIHKGKKLSKEEIKKRTETRRKNGWYKNPQEQSKIISERNRGNKYNLGRKFSNEHRKNISIGLKNKRKSKEHIEKIKENRKNQILPFRDTSIELKIQNFLKELSIDFITHKYIKDIKHGYQCDIFIPSMNLIIECDGNYFHGNPNIFRDEQLNERFIKQREIDKLRTKELEEQGYTVIRLWEEEINKIMLYDFKIKIENGTKGNNKSKI